MSRRNKNKLRNNKYSPQIPQEENISLSLHQLQEQKRLMQIKENLLLEKAFKGDNPNDILFANDFLNKKKSNSSRKSYLLDPQDLNSSLGFKEKFSSLSYDILRGMAKTPINKAIIGTRIDQIAAFSEAQDDINKVGWSIRKKKKFFSDREELTDVEKVEVDNIINFIINCGIRELKHHGDDFESFIRKFFKDSLELDQGVFEVPQTRGGKPYEFYACDGSTFRLANSYQNKFIREGQQEINGFYPFYVQIYQGIPHAEFYPWELCFGTRNMSTSIRNAGYGISELEDMIKIVTWQLFADQYNGRFFSQGSNPKGLLKIQGEVDDDKLQDFRNHWRQQVSGVENAWKVPIIQGDSVDWINMQLSNNDMQFSQWQEYLIRLNCALYKIAPEEIGFVLNQSTGEGGGTTYNGNQEYKLDYSQAKGLVPLLKFGAKTFNKMIVSPLTNDKYEFFWTGVKDTTEDADLKTDIDKFNSGIYSWKELRKKHNKPEKLEPDDWLGNQIWLQIYQQKQMGNPFSNDIVNNEEGDGSFNPFIQYKNDLGLSNNIDISEQNPFMKDLSSYMEGIIKKA